LESLSQLTTDDFKIFRSTELARHAITAKHLKHVTCCYPSLQQCCDVVIVRLANLLYRWPKKSTRCTQL